MMLRAGRRMKSFQPKRVPVFQCLAPQHQYEWNYAYVDA